MRRLSLTNLETLCWIARLGSFTAAAQRLNTSQPAISGRVRELEQSLGVALFHRQGRRMELTILGRELVERAQPLLNRLEDVVISLENPAAATGIIRIGVGEMVAVTWFGAMMARLQREMPRVTYQVEVDLTVNMRQKLELGGLDLAILAAPLDSNRLTSTSLGSLAVLWVAGPAIARAARRQAQDPAALLAAHPIWSLPRPSYMHPMAIESLRRHRVAQTRVSTCNSLQSMVEIVAQGGGIALLPENLVAAHLRAGTLAPLSAALPPQRLEFVIAHHRDQEQTIIGHIVAAAVDASAFLAAPLPTARARRA
ncbi:MAG: LysR family transcriptional regulator [Burkholderiales bacterium]|nr:LysR family transcriptional regulator [Burkholderiales bacterium]